MEKIVKVLKKIKIKNMIILIILLAFNTYAWFIYASKVSVGLTAHVSSWNVEFETGTETTTNMTIEIDRVYPGMDTFERIIDVRNRGETAATLSYEIEYLRVMNEEFEVSETSGLTTNDLKEKMETDYPFKLRIEQDSVEINAHDGVGQFIITFEWPFESGDDALDTLWGNKAYEYYSLNPNKSSIEVHLQLIATQT